MCVLYVRCLRTLTPMITVRHIDRVCLQENFYKKFIDKYSKLNRDLLVVFDLRISCFGMHEYDFEKKLHTIRISPVKNAVHVTSKDVIIQLDIESEKYNLLSTTLHELYHGEQRETLKKGFFNSNFLSAKVKNVELKEFWSRCEVEARKYELEHILEGVAYYNELIK